jgi:hypothetical protein
MSKLFTTSCFSLLFTASAVAQCGGLERWAVKDGTDASAGQVDFGKIQAATLADLISIKEPRLPADHTTRLPQETRVIRLTARLIQWKLETDDDYHLVLTDDTENFTPAHGKPTGHSLIGEIPSPDCLSGSTGEFGSQSPFIKVAGTSLGIAVARSQLNDAFPNADLTGGWNDAAGARVEIVGVQFFDRAHGQVSRAPNNLEIHPIVSITFLDNPQHLLVPAVAAPAAHPHAAAAAHGAPPQKLQPLIIEDADTGESATVNEDRALRVAPSELSGKSGMLKSGLASPDLGFPKTLTVCWFAGPSGSIQISIDGKNWFDVDATVGASCKSVPPARFVKLTSTKGMYQVSY